MMQPAVPETRQLREERIQRARPPSYEYGIEILATLYVVSSYYNWIHSLFDALLLPSLVVVCVLAV